MGRHRTRVSSDTSSDTSESDYSSSVNDHFRRNDFLSNTFSTRLRPRNNRKNVMYKELDSELDDFDESEEEVVEKVTFDKLPVAVYNTIEKFIARRLVKSSNLTNLPCTDSNSNENDQASSVTNSELVEPETESIQLNRLIPESLPKCKCLGKNFSEASKKPRTFEYLIKFHKTSYLHCEWVSEEYVLKAIANDRPLRTRFNNFCKRLDANIDIPEQGLVDAIPERIVDCSDQFRALYPTKAAEIGRNEWMMYCLKIVDALVCFTRDHRTYGVPFLRAVDEEKDGAPGYYSVVKVPMDITTIQIKLYLRKYESPQEFWSDVKLIFANCNLYNSPQTDISTQCRVLEALFDKLYFEWAKMSRENMTSNDNKTQSLSMHDCEDTVLPFVPLTDEDLTVEKVIQHISFLQLAQNSNRQLLYLVKWKRRWYTELSWESADDITDKMKIALYHRHVRVPEYNIDSRGSTFWETELQRRMLQETLLYCKAAKDYLHGNMAISVQSLPTLSTGQSLTSKSLSRTWSYNACGSARSESNKQNKVPCLYPYSYNNDFKQQQQQQYQRNLLVCRNMQYPHLQSVLMNSFSMNPELFQGRLTGIPLHLSGSLSFPGYMNPNSHSQYSNTLKSHVNSDNFSKPLPYSHNNNYSCFSSANVAANSASARLIATQSMLESKMNNSEAKFENQQVLNQTPQQPFQHIPVNSHIQSPMPQVYQIPNSPIRSSISSPMPSANLATHSQSGLLHRPIQNTMNSITQLNNIPQTSYVSSPTSNQNLMTQSTSSQIINASLNALTNFPKSPNQGDSNITSENTGYIKKQMTNSNDLHTDMLCELGSASESIHILKKTAVDWKEKFISFSDLKSLLNISSRKRLIETELNEKLLARPKKIISRTDSIKDKAEGVLENIPKKQENVNFVDDSIPETTNNIKTEIENLVAQKTSEFKQLEILTNEAFITQKLDPQSINPQAVNPQAMNPQAMNPQAMNPQAMNPQTINPQTINSQTINPQAINPQAINPQAINPQTINPHSINPQAINPPTLNSVNLINPNIEETKPNLLSLNLKASQQKNIVLDKSRPATLAANSIYAKQFCQMKKPKSPPPGTSRHYPVSPTYKGNKKLFDYQLDGLNWLLDLWASGNNGILADEMGLGKTIQSLALLWHLYTKEKMRGPFLVVAPLSTLDHWRISAENWTDFNVILYYDEGGRVGRDALRQVEWYHYMLDTSTRRSKNEDNVNNASFNSNPRLVPTYHYKFQLLLTSYEIFVSDAELLAPIAWQFVVVDEAHRLKNRLSKTLLLLKQVACRHTLLLTGTPVQNNTEELWPLLNYIEPVRFCDVDAFKLEFGELQTSEQVKRLTDLLRPHLLRRVKEDVADSIPPLEETIIDVELTILQKAYYKAIFERNKNFLFKNARKGQQLPSLMNVEMELRKCCNHPFMIHGVEMREYANCRSESEKFKKLVESSGKLVLLDKLLPKLMAENHKVLIFSQFQHTLTIIQEFLQYKNWPFERLDGQVRGVERSSAISRFNDPSSHIFVFLLSTRAGGLGINLTSADTVIIFDSDWNPQNDIQATARAHRIGQEREVKVYRLVTARTYEADMFDRASKKLGLNTAVFHRGAFDSKNRSDKKKKIEDNTDENSIANSKTPSKDEIEELLKKGAFYLLENSAKASREFQENNIDEILSKNSRLVRYQMTGMNSTFAKTSFKSDKASDISLDDPDFWQKVLNDSSSRRLLARLNDGSATASPEAMDNFMIDLQAAVESIAAEDDPEPVIEALVQLSNLTTFSSEHREQAEEWLARVNLSLETIREVPYPQSTVRSPTAVTQEADLDNEDESINARRSTRTHRLEMDEEKWTKHKDAKDSRKRLRLRRNIISSSTKYSENNLNNLRQDISEFDEKILQENYASEDPNSKPLYSDPVMDLNLSDFSSDINDDDDADSHRMTSRKKKGRNRKSSLVKKKRSTRTKNEKLPDPSLDVLQSGNKIDQSNTINDKKFRKPRVNKSSKQKNYEQNVAFTSNLIQEPSFFKKRRLKQTNSIDTAENSKPSETQSNHELSELDFIR